MQGMLTTMTTTTSPADAGWMHLRRDALRQRPSFHGRLVLHVLDLLLQCVLVHGGEHTGIHGYSRTPLVAIGNGIARAPSGKINRFSGLCYRPLYL